MFNLGTNLISAMKNFYQPFITCIPVLGFSLCLAGCAAQNAEQVKAFEDKLTATVQALEDTNAVISAQVSNHPFSAGLSNAFVLDSGISASASIVSNPSDLSAKKLLQLLIDAGVVGPGGGVQRQPAEASGSGSGGTK